MAYITPNSTVKLLKGVPLNNSYINTVYFANATAQADGIGTNAYYPKTYTSLSYQRVNKNTIRLQERYENIMNYNYMMFKNTAYDSSKWFYAFLTKVNYINDAVVEIIYEIDVMQTWMFDYTLERCFVERETSATDVIGDNLVAESINTGDLVCKTYTNPDWFDEYNILIWYARTDQGRVTNTFPYLGGTFNGLYFQILPCNSLSEARDVQNAIDDIVDNWGEESIVSIAMIPDAFCPAEHTAAHLAEPQAQTTSVTRPTSLAGGYVPRNNKLFTYPYCFLNVDASSDSKSYRWEWVYNNTGVINLRFASVLQQNFEITGYPIAYNGTTSLIPPQINETESVKCEGFGQCAYNIDSYHAYLARTAGGTLTQLKVLNGLNGLLGAGGQFASGNFLGSFGSGLSAINSAATTAVQAEINSTINSKGRSSSGDLLDTGCRNNKIVLKTMTVQPQFASIIDDYFDRFGYATERIKIPNRNVRPFWTFTKTRQCEITGGICQDDITKIESVYNNGVTFWTSLASVGHYEYDNSPA